MRTRLLIGPLIVLAISGLIGADEAFWPADRPAISALIALLAILGWWELSAMAGMGRGGAARDPALRLLGGLGVLYFHAIAWWTSRAGATGPTFETLALPGILGCLLGAYSLVVFRKEFLRPYRALQETIAGMLLLGLFFAYLIRIYHFEAGGWRLALCFLVGIKGCDVAAYLVGMSIGRHRFLAVSPKKSLEGCLGALAWGGLWFSLAPGWLGLDLFGWWQGALSGIILATIAQIGDYTESLVKREYHVKDSRALLPEFGGVLDLVDSLVFTGIVFWHLLPADTPAGSP